MKNEDALKVYTETTICNVMAKYCDDQIREYSGEMFRNSGNT